MGCGHVLLLHRSGVQDSSAAVAGQLRATAAPGIEPWYRVLERIASLVPKG